MNRMTIMIPTYNRADFLYKNVKEICTIIKANLLADKVYIYISDNASTDHTIEIMKKLEEEAGEVKVICRYNKNNVGISENLMGILKNVQTEYAMVLGDDDFIEPEYLSEAMEKINADMRIGCIVPSYQNITVDGRKMNRSRDLGKAPKLYKKGFYNCFVNSWRAHQLSGLVFKVDNLYSKSREVALNNLYLFVYWVAEACLQGSTLHLTTYPIKVTRPSQAAKTWSYGKDGLINEFFQNYRVMSELSYVQRSLLEVKFLYSQYWRYAMYLKLGIGAFFKCILSIMTAENATYITRVLFIIYLPLIGILQSLKLLFTGKIFEVLSTKVEV